MSDNRGFEDDDTGHYAPKGLSTSENGQTGSRNNTASGSIIPVDSNAQGSTQGKKVTMEDHELSESLLDVPNGNAKFVVERPVFSQQKFDEGFIPGSRPQSNLKTAVKKQLSKCNCSRDCFVKFLYSVFPFLQIMKEYKVKEYLSGDVVSGLTVGIMHIPQGMAYGMLTGLPPVYGLYVSFFPVLVYFFLGTSRHISVGTFAVASLMVGSAIGKHVTDEPPAATPTMASVTGMGILQSNVTVGLNSTSSPNITNNDGGSAAVPNNDLEKLEWAMAITMMTGIIQLVMSVTRLGFVTVYLSDPLISGFTTGAACHVFTSQITHIFGIETGRYSGAFKLIYSYRDFFSNIPQTNSITLITSILCMVLIYCVKEFINNNPKIKPKLKMPVPIDLIVVVLGTVISYLVGLEENQGVKNVGAIPTGIPAPKPPNFSLLPDVISDSIALAIVVFAVSVSMGKILSKNYDYEINANQELLAYAACNIFSCFFSAYVSSASLSRSLVQEGVGGKTQLAGLISSALLLLVLLLIGPYFSTLPKCVLASIIIIALKGMFKQLLELPRLWRLSKIDFFVWILTFIATVLLDVDLGLLAGVIIAIMTIVFRVQRPYVCLMGQMPDTDIYRDLSVYKEAKEVPDIKIFRFENALFFVSVEYFKNSLYKYTVNPRTLKKLIKSAESKMEKNKMIKQNENGSVEVDLSHQLETPVPTDTTVSDIPRADFSSLVLDCSAWSFIDSMGVKVLGSVINEFKAVGINVHLALCKAGVREMFEKTAFFDILDRDNLFVSIHDAVLFAQHSKRQSRMFEVVTNPNSKDIELNVKASSDSDTDVETEITSKQQDEESKL